MLDDFKTELTRLGDVGGVFDISMQTPDVQHSVPSFDKVHGISSHLEHASLPALREGVQRYAISPC